MIDSATISLQYIKEEAVSWLNEQYEAQKTDSEIQITAGSFLLRGS